MQVHLKDDKVLSKKETTKIETLLNKETRNWIQIMNIGDEVKQKERTISNLVSTDNPIPILRGTSKDHKAMKDPEKGHDLRPIMGANIGPNHSLAQIGSKFLRAIADNVKETSVIKSTEELLRKFEEYNSRIVKNEPGPKKVVFSMDIKSFYPSLDPVRAANIARLMWLKSDLNLKKY